ncbi:MAG TPA: hypothetical protein VGN61_11520 [Verrucomicrobiae bacterium]
MKKYVARCIGLLLLPLSVLAQPILIAPQQNQVFPGSSLSNLRLLKQSANGTEAILTLSFVYDGLRGPTALLLPMITDRKDSKIAGWFGANPVTISSGRGTISLRVRFFNDDPGVPSELTTDHVRILMLTDGGNAVISEGIFPVTIRWGGSGTAPAPDPQADEQARLKAEEEKRIAEEHAKAEAAHEAQLQAEAAAAEQARQDALAKQLAQEKAKAETEAKAREEARLKAEAEAQARNDAEAKRVAEAKAKSEAEVKAREEARLEAAAEEKAIEDARLKAELEERARQEAAAKRLAEAKAKVEAEAEAREEARLKAEVEEKARQDAAAKLFAEEKAKAEAEARAREEARLKAEAEEKARQEVEAKRLAEEKAKAEAEAKSREETRLKAEAEAQARQEAAAKLLADEKAKAEAEAKAREEARLEAERLAEEKAKAEAEAKAQAEAAKRLAEEKAAAANAVPKTGFILSSTAKTKVTNLDVVNRNLDRTEMTIAVEYEYSKGDGPVRMGVDVATTSDPEVSRYFSCTPVNIGKGSRNFVMFPVKLDAAAAQSLKRSTLPTDKVWIYLVNGAGEKSYIFQGTMMLVWHIPGGEQEAPDASWAAAVRNTLEIESFKQNDLFSGYVTVKYNLRSAEGHLHLSVYDSANPGTASWFESDDIPIKSGPGLQLVRINVPKKALSPDAFKVDTVEIQMLDANGTLLASSHNQSPMSWAKPK